MCLCVACSRPKSLTERPAYGYDGALAQHSTEPPEDGKPPANRPRPAAERTPDILARLHHGDQAAYEVLFRRYRVPLEKFLRSHTDPGLRRHLPLEDLAQETHVEALRSIASFTYQRELSFYFWLCGIARNLIAAHCRQLHRRLPMISLDEASPSSIDVLMAARARQPTPYDKTALREQIHVLAACLAQLPDIHREALLLGYIEDLDGRTAAERLGVSPGTFRTRVSRALLELHGVMQAFERAKNKPANNGDRP
jgi:RNA polymerase sigma-70 factor, ECF subfamily